MERNPLRIALNTNPIIPIPIKIAAVPSPISIRATKLKRMHRIEKMIVAVIALETAFEPSLFISKIIRDLYVLWHRIRNVSDSVKLQYYGSNFLSSWQSVHPFETAPCSFVS